MVDASAAGAEMECPGCHAPMVIPDDDVMRDRESVAAVAGRTAVLEREVAASRREVVRLEEAVQATAVQREAMQNGLAEVAKKLQQATEDLEIAREHIKALEADGSALQEKRAALEKELAEARKEHVRSEAEAQERAHELDVAHARIATAEAAASRVPALEGEVQSMQERLAAATGEARRSAEQCATLRDELTTARRELLQTESGRELAALRERFRETDAERKRLAAEIADTQAESRRHEDAERDWRAQFDAMRQQRDDALRRADATSPAALQHGNDVLRSILDRQQRELDERYVELRRLRAAQLSLRILYASAALLLFIAIVLGLRALHVMWR